VAASKKVKPDSSAAAPAKAKPSKSKKPVAKSSAKKRSAGSGTLVVVESPAKAATIKKY